MIELLLIVLGVMFGTLLFDKRLTKSTRLKGAGVFLKENFSLLDYETGLPQKQRKFNTYSGPENKQWYSLNTNMKTYHQPINNIASIYGYRAEGYDTTPKRTVSTCSENDGLMGMNRWCGCDALTTSGTTETATRRLMGNVNPRTLIAPYIAPPIADQEEWGTDNYTINSAINSYRSNDLFLSGYQVLDTCMCKGVCVCKVSPSSTFSGSRSEESQKIKENFDLSVNFLSPYDITEQRYTRPQILQNKSLSVTPQQEKFISVYENNHVNFVETPIVFDDLSNNQSGPESLIYDPRTVSYSDPQRGYVDRLLGQPKFYYDDLNVARAPNFITRNNIDIYSFGASTGRLKNPNDPSNCGNPNQLAVEEFHNSALLHRTDLMRSLMSKRNGEMYQRREFPISTNGQRISGGTSKI